MERRRNVALKPVMNVLKTKEAATIMTRNVVLPLNVVRTINVAKNVRRKKRVAGRLQNVAKIKTFIVKKHVKRSRKRV